MEFDDDGLSCQQISEKLAISNFNFFLREEESSNPFYQGVDIPFEEISYDSQSFSTLSRPQQNNQGQNTAANIRKLKGSKAKRCRCTKIMCDKKYCECFRRGQTCGKACKCFGCNNQKPKALKVRFKDFWKYSNSIFSTVSLTQ